MFNEEQWQLEAKAMMRSTQQVDEQMRILQRELHQLAAQRLFELFPKLSDEMDADEIRLLGERLARRIYDLTEELKNFAYTVQLQRGQ